MAFESNNFCVVKKEKLTRGEFSVDCLVQVEGASKILSLSTDASVSSCEVLNGVINFAGCVDVAVVYLGENGETECAKACCPFTSKFEGENIATGNKAIINVKVIDCEVSSVSADSVKLVCLVEQNGQLVCSQEVSSIKTDEEDICFKSEDIGVIRLIGEASEVATIKSELTPRGNVKKVLLGESQVIIRNVESGVNFVSVSGDVVTRVLYLTDEGKFETGVASESFKEEVELEGTARESLVEAYGSVKRDNVQIEVIDSDKGQVLSLSVPVSLNVKAYEETTASVIKDLYSTKCDIKVTTESFDMTKVCKNEIVEGKIDGTLSLDEDKPRIDKILFVGGNSVTISNSYLSNGEVVIEGIAKTYVIYLNDEENSLNSVQIDIPFSISDKFSVENTDGILSAEAIVCDVDVVAKKGREIFYDAKVKACVNYCYNVVSGVITNAEVSSEYPEKDFAMELIFAQSGMDAWDIAKQARVKEELILAQNPEITFPLTEDAGLVLFYQKTK